MIKKIAKYKIVIMLVILSFASGLYVAKRFYNISKINADMSYVNAKAGDIMLEKLITAVNIVADNIIPKRKVILSAKQFNEIPIVRCEELPNADIHPSLVQFKMKSEDGYILVDIVNVDGNEDDENGINIFITPIEMDKT